MEALVVLVEDVGDARKLREELGQADEPARK